MWPWATVTLTHASVLQAFIIWRVQMSKINRSAIFNMFLTWAPSRIHASLETRKKVQRCSEFIWFQLFSLYFYLVNSLNNKKLSLKNAKFAKCICSCDLRCLLFNKNSHALIRLWVYLTCFYSDLNILLPNSTNSLCLSGKRTIISPCVRVHARHKLWNRHWIYQYLNTKNVVPFDDSSTVLESRL